MIFDWFKDKVAILPLQGQITESQGMGLFPSFMQSSISKMEEYLDEIEEDKKYKGLILEINSPGGSPYKSRQFAKKISNMNIFKIALIEEQGTSGAYWIANACDVIVADELSSVGGIGTISIRPDLTDFLEKFGIKMDVQEEGKYKDEGMPFSKVTEEEKEHRQEMIKEINDMFKRYIKSKRNISEDSEALEGKVFLGTEAKEEGLVDHLGDRNKALKIFQKRTGVRDYKVKDFKEELEKGPSILDLFR